MSKTSCIFIILLGLAIPSAAQTATPPFGGASKAKQPRFDTALSAGLIVARMPEIDEPYYQDWYGEDRYAGSIGYYLTKNVKAEFEHAWSGEASRMLLDYTPINGQPYPFQVEQFFQLQQSTFRVVWQFRDNEWVHPYVSAGAVLDIEHQRSHVLTTYQPGPRGERVLVSTERDLGDRTEYRGGLSLSGGAKFYVTPRAFINTGAIVTFSKPVGTVSFIAGFGFDF